MRNAADFVKAGTPATTPPKHSEAANAPARAPRPEGACCAWGCPLWGGIRLAGNPDWVCSVHALAYPMHWQAITQRLNECREVINEIHAGMRNGSEWRSRFAEVVRYAEAVSTEGGNE